MNIRKACVTSNCFGTPVVQDGRGMCEECARIDSSAGMADAEKMAENMLKYGTIDVPKLRTVRHHNFDWHLCSCDKCVAADTQVVGPMDVGYDFHYYCPKHPMYVEIAEWGEELSGEECHALSEAVEAGLVKRSSH